MDWAGLDGSIRDCTYVVYVSCGESFHAVLASPLLTHTSGSEQPARVNLSLMFRARTYKISNE
jgi:hypothetical protein